MRATLRRTRVPATAKVIIYKLWQAERPDCEPKSLAKRKINGSRDSRKTCISHQHKPNMTQQVSPKGIKSGRHWLGTATGKHWKTADHIKWVTTMPMVVISNPWRSLLMGPDTEIWPVVLIAATIVIIFMAVASSGGGSFECVGACG